jgi:hypothetical protein
MTATFITQYPVARSRAIYLPHELRAIAIDEVRQAAQLRGGPARFDDYDIVVHMRGATMRAYGEDEATGERFEVSIDL